MVAKAIPRNFLVRPFLYSFCAAWGLKERKTSLLPNNANFTSLFCADSNEQNGWRDNGFFRVEEINDEDVYEIAVGMANRIAVFVSKQDISVCPCRPSKIKDNAQ